MAVTVQWHLAAVIWLTRPAAPQASLPFAEPAESAALRMSLRRVPHPVTPARIGHAVVHADKRHRQARVAASSKVGTATAEARTSAERAMLYAPDGAILLPRAAMIVTGRDPDQADMRHFQQLPCHGTRFSYRYARAQDESLGNEVARKYPSWIGLYNRRSEVMYRKRRAWHDRACAP